ncbi:competence type IV pilus minor pilin ComGD [Listeria booriae]|uniref:competence type IV pilus minor pilin ComGD n=1 Tax=Listeria booriae TaxID=1552123 RepID=UPI002892B956|nr:competence type IV pilus minor pilin ComGD [Listeria booriae]
MRQNGFTLMEMLLVLAITLIICSISFIPAGSLIVQISERQSLDQLKIDIMQLQSIAVLTNQETILTLDGSKYIYFGTTTDSVQPKLSRKFTETLKFAEKSEQVFRFSPPYGNINKFKTIVIEGFKKKYALIFQIGKGRFRIEEI